MRSDCNVQGVATTPGRYSSTIRLTVAGFDGGVTTRLDLEVPELLLKPILTAGAPVGTDRVLILGTTPLDTQVFEISGYTPTSADNLTFVVTSGAVPPGLVFNLATGAITGTLTTLGQSMLSTMVTVRRNGLSYSTPSATVVFGVNEPPLALDYSGCCTASVATPFTFSPISTFIPANNAGIQYQVIGGTLPAGIFLDSTTGRLSGTPTVAGDYTFQVRANVSLPTGPQSISSAITTLASRGIFPFYPITANGRPTTYAPPGNYPYAISVQVDPGTTTSVAPGNFFGGLAGDTYYFSLTGDPFQGNIPPSWVTIDSQTGIVTISAPTNAPNVRGTRFGVEVKVTRSGTDYSQVQGWVLNVP